MNVSQVFRNIEKEQVRQRDGIELIASENYVSKDVLRAMGTELTNKYAEGYPGRRYYGGCEFVDEVERIAVDNVKELFRAEYANVQPHSGSQANASVYLACLQPGDPILGFDLSHGGHLSHGSRVNYSGKTYAPHFYGVHPETGMIEMEQVRKKAEEVRPKLIICGASAYSRDWDYEAFREIADAHDAILVADIAHPAGLVACNLLNDPLPHVHIATSTTHKTLRGPRGGLILAGKNIPNPMGDTYKSGKVKALSSVLNSGVFPGMQGGPLMHVIAAKAVAFAEALRPDFKEYCKKVISNAAVMAEAFEEKGYEIVSGGTENHLMLINLRSKGLTGKEVEDCLIKAGITVNKNLIPFDREPPSVTSGIRVGSAAITSRGLDAGDCRRIVDWIDTIIAHRKEEDYIVEKKKEIKAFMEKFPIHPEIQ